MIFLYLSPRLYASRSIIAFSALLVLLLSLQENHDAVSAFGSFRHVWRQRACLEGGVFMVKSYLDNLSGKPSTAVEASAVTSTESDKVVSELLDLKSSLTRLTSKMSTKKASSRQLTAEEELKARKLESSISMISGITSALLSRLEDLSASKKASGTSITTRRVDKGVPSSSFTPTEGQVRSVTSLSDSSNVGSSDSSLQQLNSLGTDSSGTDNSNSYTSSGISPFSSANSATTGSIQKPVPEPLKGSDSTVFPASSGSLEGTITVQNAPSTEKESGSLRRSTSFMGSYLDSLSSKSLSTSPLDGGFGVGRGSSISDAPREIDQLSKAVSGIAALSSGAAKPLESRAVKKSTLKTDSENLDKELSVDSAISIILKSLEAGEFDVETATKIGTYLKTLGIGEGSTPSLAASIVGKIPSKPTDTSRLASGEQVTAASPAQITTNVMPLMSSPEKEVASQPKPKDPSSKQTTYRKKAASSSLTGKSPFYSSVLADDKGMAETKQALAVPTEDATSGVSKEFMIKDDDGSIPVNLKRAIIAGYSILGLGIVSGVTLQYMTNGNPPDLASFVQGFRTKLESVININSEDVEKEISEEAALGTTVEGSGVEPKGEISIEAKAEDLSEESTGEYVIDAEGESPVDTELETMEDTTSEAFSVESAEESATSTDVEETDQPNIDTESEDLLVESMEDSVVDTEGELINEPVEDAKSEDLSVESVGESAVGTKPEEIATESTEVTENEIETPDVSILNSESEDYTVDSMGVPSTGTETEESGVESEEEGSAVDNLSTDAAEGFTGKSAADLLSDDTRSEFVKEPTLDSKSEGPEASFTEDDEIGAEFETSVAKPADAVLETPSNDVEPEPAVDIPSKEIKSEYTEESVVDSNSEGSTVLFSTGEDAVSTESDNSALGIETFGMPVESLTKTSPVESVERLAPESVVSSVSTDSESKFQVESAVSRFLKALGSGEITADTAAKVESAIDIFLESFRAKDDLAPKLFPGTRPTVDSAISTFLKAMASGDVTLETATMVESAIEKFLLGYGGREVNL